MAASRKEQASGRDVDVKTELTTNTAEQCKAIASGMALLGGKAKVKSSSSSSSDGKKKKKTKKNEKKDKKTKKKKRGSDSDESSGKPKVKKEKPEDFTTVLGKDGLIDSAKISLWQRFTSGCVLDGDMWIG